MGPRNKSPHLFLFFCLSFWDSSRMTPLQIWVIWGPNPPKISDGKNPLLVTDRSCRCFLIWIWMLQKLVAPWNGYLVNSWGVWMGKKWGGWDWLVGKFREEVWVDFFCWVDFLFDFRFCFVETDFASLILLKIQIQTLEVREIFSSDFFSKETFGIESFLRFSPLGLAERVIFERLSKTGLPPRTRTWQWKIHHEWRCMSYLKMGVSNVMLVFRGVPKTIKSSYHQSWELFQIPFH